MLIWLKERRIGIDSVFFRLRLGPQSIMCVVLHREELVRVRRSEDAKQEVLQCTVHLGVRKNLLGGVVR